MPIETEIKFRVADLAALTERLQSAGFRLETPRSFESNVLYDTPGRQLRARTEILRIRSYVGRWTLTHKRPPNNRSRVKIATNTASKPRPESPTATRSPNFFSVLDWLLRFVMRSGARNGPTARATASSTKPPSAITRSWRALRHGSTAPRPGSASLPHST